MHFQHTLRKLDQLGPKHNQAQKTSTASEDQYIKLCPQRSRKAASKKKYLLYKERKTLVSKGAFKIIPPDYFLVYMKISQIFNVISNFCTTL